jgi:hypothetical protein
VCHEFEQIDQGEAYCLDCNTTDRNEKCEKPAPSKQPERVTLPRESEIESIKRTLYNAIDKLDRLTAK